MNGKLTDGRIEYAPRTITKDGVHYNPYPDDMQIEDGYKPIIETPVPEDEPGYYWVSHWEQDEDNIYRVWEKHESEPTPEERIEELEAAFAALIRGDTE